MFSFWEIIDVLATILLAGFILQPLSRNLKQSFALAGLSIVLHELGHKFTALAFGFNAVYHASYAGLGLGLLLRFIGVPVFFVPAYVSISGPGVPIGYTLTALAGPLVNITLYFLSYLALSKLYANEWVIQHSDFLKSLMIINLWLGIINLIPFPGTDGFNALVSLRYL